MTERSISSPCSQSQTGCGDPRNFENKLVGGSLHGGDVPQPQHGIKPLLTVDKGTYRPMKFLRKDIGWSGYIWFHEVLTDAQAAMWVNDLAWLEDLEAAHKRD